MEDHNDILSKVTVHFDAVYDPEKPLPEKLPGKEDITLYDLMDREKAE